ncbi:MAG: ATP-dependent protease LonB [Candidatus Thermoplasmatota archaeon]|nr:ATP-dependent protease LonB [Candidatus Thermoplasmatota archaeon]
MEKQEIETTESLEIPELLMDQVIGQDHAVDVVRQAARQKRHVMLIGDPGTGKSMVARAMTEFLPKEELEDMLVYPNADDPNTPRVRVVPATKGKEIVESMKAEARRREQQQSQMMTTILALIVGGALIGAIIMEDLTIALFGIIAAAMIYLIGMRGGIIQRREEKDVPKLLVSHEGGDVPPFIDATAAHSGALLGDVRHDPFQAGGLETPAHLRVEAGAIHKAHKGVLYIDEINTLSLPSQQHLLTAIQEKKFQITGQSERSSGAMVKTENVPCDFILVCAGNLDAVEGMHPALRSRIRGYGYEIYVKSRMEDNDENRKKLVRFVAQEVAKDKKIPHFNKGAVAEIIREAQRRAGQKGRLSLRLRELGGLVRVAGDLAVKEEKNIVTADHVIRAKEMARSLEQQVADRYLKMKKVYQSFKVSGAEIGTVNGLAIMSADPSMSEFSGLILPIVAEVTPAGSKSEGKIIATGRLGEIANEAVQNVSAILKKYMGEDISKRDIHIQFVGTYEGVEGDSASISVATAVISAMENVPLSQEVGMTGSLSVHGTVLPIGGVTAKIEAAAKAGLKKVLIPKANTQDVLIEDEYKDKIEIIPVETLKDVLENVLVGEGKKKLLKKLEALQPSVTSKVDLESEKAVIKIPVGRRRTKIKKPVAEGGV